MRLALAVRKNGGE